MGSAGTGGIVGRGSAPFSTGAYRGFRVGAEDLNRDFVGGPPHLFEAAGREQLIVLLEHGLRFDSIVLDVGCGALRGGRWVIPLLDTGHYCGIEPVRAMVERGLRDFVDPGIVALRRPRFDHNDRFDFSVFGVAFTHVVARSIWTHSSKLQIETMLESFLACGTEESVFLASFLPGGEEEGLEDYAGDAWVGRSHMSEQKGVVGHSWAWIVDACEGRGLVARRLDRPPLHRQVWCSIQRT